MRIPVVTLRLTLALLVGPALACALAVALTRWWPDADGLNRLYRGLFIGAAFQAVWMTACLLARRPGPQPWKRMVSATHTWAGALTGAMLFVICLSGTLAVLKPELQRWEYLFQPSAPTVATDVDAWVQAGLTCFPGAAALSLQWPDPLTGQVTIRPGGGMRADRQAPLTLLADGTPAAPLQTGPATALLVELHRSLHLGFPGRIFISLFGFALLLFITTGLVLHPRQRATALRLRLRQRLAIWARDAHLLMGLWLVPGLLLIAVTGVFSGLGALGTLTLAPHAFPDAPQQAMRALMPAYQQAPARQPAAMPPLSEILARHQRAHPGFQPSQAVLHHWGDAQAYVTLSGTQRWQLSTPLFEQFHYRAADGALLHHDSAAGRAPWVQAFIAIQPLHFAAYAGAASRWAHALIGLALCLLCASGLYLWQRRGQGGGTHWSRRLPAGICIGLSAACCALWAVAWLLPAQTDARATWLGWAFWLVWPALTLRFTLAPRGARSSSSNR